MEIIQSSFRDGAGVECLIQRLWLNIPDNDKKDE